MAASYTFDVFSSLDGYGAASGDWTGYWGKQGPELLEHRFDLYGEEQRMVLGRQHLSGVRGDAGREQRGLRGPRPMGHQDVEAAGDSGVDDARRTPRLAGRDGRQRRRGRRRRPLKEESDVPLRSHGSLAMNRALMAAGLVDRVQVTLFPVITGQTGLRPDLRGAADFDLELIETRTLDGHIQELVYRPTLH